MDVQNSQALELTTFVQLCFNDKVLDEYEVCSPVMSIGRNVECDIVIDNAAVSSFHALLSQKDGKLFVEDAASTNGVMTDGIKKSVVELAPGESVQIAGKYSLRLISTPTRTPAGTPAKDKKSDQPNERETLIVSTTTLARVGRGTRPAYLTLSGPGRPSWIIRLEKPSTSIGRKRSSDVRVGGWFSPATLASVERRDDGFYLSVLKANHVSIDGESVNGDCRLEEGNRIDLGGVTGVFHERTNLRHG